MKLFVFALLFLILVAQYASANAVIIAAGASAAHQQIDDESLETVRNTQSCMPPIHFATENHCILKTNCPSCINQYVCGNYVLVGDCKGGVVDVENNSVDNYRDLFLVCCAGAISIVLLSLLWGALK